MAAYYNENDPYAAQWLRNLIEAGHIAPGYVDDCSITDTRASDLTGFTQHHFFAGIGVWSYALRLAGWPDDRPIWTGSCPCQPFSNAGKRRGAADSRHLWPVWERLIRECSPATIIGEQVASKDALAWLDIVSADLENQDYAFAAADLPVAGVGGPHWRQRLWWVAHAGRAGLPSRECRELPGPHGNHQRRAAQQCGCASVELAYPDSNGCAQAGQRLATAGNDELVRNDISGGVAHTSGIRCQGLSGRWQEGVAEPSEDDRPGPVNGFWADADWLLCTDDKWRPVEPGTQPLAHGVAGRVGQLRAYGNAICPEEAKIFIEAIM